MDDVLKEINSLPEQLLQSKILARDVSISGAKSLLLCGVGGSGLPAEVLYSLSDYIKLPVVPVKDYFLPNNTTSGDVVIVISYSGNTEEALSCYEEAKILGLRIIAVASGGKLKELATKDGFEFIQAPSGLQPRGAIGYLTGIILTILKNSGLAGQEIDLDLAVNFLKSQDYRDQAKLVAAQIGGKLPHIYSSRRLWGAAYKWKIAIDENGKREAFCNQLPEMNHNELQGFSSGPRWSPVCIFLVDSEEHARMVSRIRITKDLIAKRMGEANTIEIAVKGPSHLARLFSAIQLGDLVAWHLAQQDGVNPGPSPMVEELKSALGPYDYKLFGRLNR